MKLAISVSKGKRFFYVRLPLECEMQKIKNRLA
jgi:hypothetical protein